VLGLIIPPSITMVILGITANISIGKLFLAGIIPGIILTLMLCIYVTVIAKIKGYGEIREEKVTNEDFLKTTKEAFLPLLAPVFILGSIFLGVATATEAAVIAVAYSFLLTIYYKEMSFPTFKHIMKDSAITSASILVIISAASAFTYLLTVKKIPATISDFFFSYVDSPIMFLLVVSLILFILGMLTEVTSLIILLSPIFMPLAIQYNIDQIHFGMVLITNYALANITTLVGLSLIAGCSITDKGMSIEKTLPYIVHILIIVAVMVILIIFFPALSTFLPSMMIE